MKIILFNGPPGSGKDTISDALVKPLMLTQIVPPVRMSFAEPLKLQTAALLGITLKKLEEIKDIPHPMFDGGTPRQYMINLSEVLIKPVYGQKFFGNVATNKLKNSRSNLALFSDSGFAVETEPLIAEFGIDNIIKFGIRRTGTNFDNDSRSYWSIPGLRSIPIDNNGTIEAFEFAVMYHLISTGFI